MVTYSLKEVFVVFKLKVTFKTYYMCYWYQATYKKNTTGQNSDIHLSHCIHEVSITCKPVPAPMYF